MSDLVVRKDFTDMVEVWYTQDEKIGTFQKLECEEHGNSWHFTDKSGTDNCIECIEDMCSPKITYTMPGLENLEESLEKLSIRKNSYDTTHNSIREE